MEREDSSKAFEIIEHETWKGTIQAKHLKQWNMSFKQCVVELTQSAAETVFVRGEVCIKCSAANVSASFNQRRMHYAAQCRTCSTMQYYAVHNEAQCRTCILSMAENVCSRQDVLVYTCKVM